MNRDISSVGRGVMWARLLVLTLAFAWLMLGPALPQLLGIKTRLLPSWTMFRGHGKEAVDARFYAMDAGVPRRLDPAAALADPETGDPPSWARRIRNAEGAERVGRALCDTLGVPEPDVRLKIRQGSFHGWRSLDAETGNLCLARASGGRFWERLQRLRGGAVEGDPDGDPVEVAP